MVEEWGLPPTNKEWELNLIAGELQLIDWVLCVYSHTLALALEEYIADHATNSEYVPGWHDLRIRVWSGLDFISKNTPEVKTGVKPDEIGARFEIEESEAKVMLATLPTTHKWGTGEDVGYSLKMKLSQLLRGVYVYPEEIHIENKELQLEEAKEGLEEGLDGGSDGNDPNQAEGESQGEATH